MWRHILPLGISMSVALLAGAAAGPRSQPQTSGVTNRLRGVSAISDLVAWSSGANGTVLRTLDGGRTWQVLQVPDAGELDFRDIDAMSEREAYVLSIGPGDSSRIYKTTDAGAHWTQQFTSTDPRVFLGRSDGLLSIPCDLIAVGYSPNKILPSSSMSPYGNPSPGSSLRIPHVTEEPSRYSRCGVLAGTGHRSQYDHLHLY